MYVRSVYLHIFQTEESTRFVFLSLNWFFLFYFLYFLHHFFNMEKSQLNHKGQQQASVCRWECLSCVACGLDVVCFFRYLLFLCSTKEASVCGGHSICSTFVLVQRLMFLLKCLQGPNDLISFFFCLGVLVKYSHIFKLFSFFFVKKNAECCFLKKCYKIWGLFRNKFLHPYLPKCSWVLHSIVLTLILFMKYLLLK